MNIYTTSSVDLHKRLGKSHSYVAGVIEGLVVSGRFVSPQDFEARGSFKGASERAFSRKYFLSESACRVVTAAIKGESVPAPSIKKDVQANKRKATAKRRKPMNEIIKIGSDSIGGEGVSTINARDLHAALGVGKDFSNWIKAQVERARLVENRDYVKVAQKGELSATNQTRVEYHLTIEAGKHVAMMSGTDKGFEVRDYFIECERKAKSPAALPSYPEALRQLASKLEENNALHGQIEAQKPMVEFHNSVAAATNSVLLGDFCKMLPNAGITMGRNNTFAWLRSEKILDYKNLPYQQYMDRGWFTVEEKTYENDNSNGPRTVFTTKVTGKGQIGLIRKLKETDSYERFLNKQAAKNATGRDLGNNA